MTSLPVINCLTPKCGVCCMEQCALPAAWYLGATQMGDPSTLPEGVRMGLEAYIRKFNREGWPDDEPCIWLNLDTMQCSNYEFRPDVCRDHEDGVVPGNAACLAYRKEYGVG